jgi:hypothetical protein
MSSAARMVWSVSFSASSVDASEIRHRVMAAAAMGARALTDGEEPAEARLLTLMDAHGRIQALRGPCDVLSFSDFRRRLTGDLALLLPAGVDAEEMAGLRLVTTDGQFEEDVYDLEQEQRYVLRTLARAARRGQRSGGGGLDAELDQERVYVALRKRQDQKAYAEGRRALIDSPAGPDGTLRKLRLPSSITDYYVPVSHAATYDRWWFGCPVCKWPMKISVHRHGRAGTGSARCFHEPHAAQGAAYHFGPRDLRRDPHHRISPAPTRRDHPQPHPRLPGRRLDVRLRHARTAVAPKSKSGPTSWIPPPP